MRKLFPLAALVLLSISCQKQDLPAPEQPIQEDVLAAIAEAGFSTNDVIRENGGYIVEGDIFIDDEFLRARPGWSTITIAEVEQYHTTNTVNEGNGRNITVSVDQSLAAYVDEVDAALKRYNDENLNLTFSRVNSGGDIRIEAAPRSARYLASAGFPTSTGDPYSKISFNSSAVGGARTGTIVTIFAHEIGHCIGYRHTDYMRRSFSCGTGGNEREGSVGAIHIPGTPTGPDRESWMLSCLSITSDRPFNRNDKVALDYLY
jgi:hypothetical protein